MTSSFTTERPDSVMGSPSMWDPLSSSSPISYSEPHANSGVHYAPFINNNNHSDNIYQRTQLKSPYSSVSKDPHGTSFACEVTPPGFHSVGGGASSYSSASSEQSSVSSNSAFSSPPSNTSFTNGASNGYIEEYALGAALSNKPLASTTSSRSPYLSTSSATPSLLSYRRASAFDTDFHQHQHQHQSNPTFSHQLSNVDDTFMSSGVLDKFSNLGQVTRESELISDRMKQLDLNSRGVYNRAISPAAHSTPQTRQGSVSSNFFPSPSLVPESSQGGFGPYFRSNSFTLGSMWQPSLSSPSVQNVSSSASSTSVLFSPRFDGSTGHVTSTSTSNLLHMPSGQCESPGLNARSSLFQSCDSSGFTSPSNSASALSDSWAVPRALPQESEFGYKSSQLPQFMDSAFSPLQSHTPPSRALSHLSNNASMKCDRNLRQQLAYQQQQQIQSLSQPQSQSQFQSNVQFEQGQAPHSKITFRYNSPKPFFPQSGYSSDANPNVSSSSAQKSDFQKPYYAANSGTPPNKTHSDFGLNTRSLFLEEFRSSKNKKYELKDIYGYVVEFSGDQYGSRFIQQRLESATSEEKEIIFEELRSNSLQLMTDVFGNYVIQKFFELGNQLQKATLARQMEGHILNLSLQMYGCRVVQKAIEHVLTQQQATLIKELDGHVMQCVKDQNGNHVVQKAVERIPAEHIGFIFDAFHSEVYNLATHPYGCRVIQRMIEYCDSDARQSILKELHGYTFHLVEDQYGNYVVQHVIERGTQADREKVMNIVKISMLSFSRHKFASNVVEKCIIHGSAAQRDQLIEEILKPRTDGIVPMNVMMKDQFANYVIQKLLVVTTGEQHHKLVEAIRPHLDQLKKFTYGKHLASIEKLINQSGAKQTRGV